ncbi:MAG: hypothetical protein N3B18_01340 [Desulfobacterota bacterium]|nr:hypothetical protein [Thermodesulfobacteriota bacterium]
MIQNQPLSKNIIYYLDLLKRGKYLVLCPVIVALIIGCAVAFKLPPVYRSEAKIFYVEAQIPEWAKLGFINIYLEAMLVFIEAIAFSGPEVVNTIKELDLYPELVDKIPMADILSHMKEHYQSRPLYTEVPGTGGKPQEVITGFEFYFEHHDPEKAFQVANMLATNFIENYKKFRENFAASTSSFFIDERERLKQEIAEIDEKIAEFKEKNVNELPELFALNYGMSDRLNAQLASIDLQLQTLYGQKRSLEAQLATMNPLVAMQGISGERIVTPEEKYATLKAELGVLLANYSEKPPDIIRLRREIAILEKQLAKKKQEESLADQVNSKSGHNNSIGAYNPAYINLKTQLEQLNFEIERQKKEREETYNDLLKYEGRVAKTPMVEKEYRILNRDLESAKKRYDDLVSQVLTLESAAAMERREMGGKLTIGQPPSIPLKPIRPNRPLIIAGFLAGGLSLGILLLLGWDAVTQTIRTSDDFAAVASDIPVLSIVPYITTEEKKRIRISLQKTAGLIVLGIIILVLVIVDVFVMNIDVLIIKILSAIRTKLLLLGL